MSDFKDDRSAQLVAEVGAVISVPRADAMDSFVLHAPLELAARAVLLARVSSDRRAAVLERIEELGRNYTESGTGIDAPTVGESSDPARAAARLVEAIESGDLDAVDRCAVLLANVASAREIVAGLSADLLTRTSAAAHAPIFLHQLRRGELPLTLLRPLARRLAMQPQARVRWFDDLDFGANGATEPESLRRALESTPALGVAGQGFVHPTLMQVEERGTAKQLLGRVLGDFNSAAAREVLRAAARSMLLESTEHAKYGWTHTLTLPQAVLGIAWALPRPALALAMGATHVLAFRASLGSGPTDTKRWIELERALGEVTPQRRERIANIGAVHEDAHAAKYTLACLDACDDDPDAGGLYLTAAERLFEAWGIDVRDGAA